MAKFHELYDFVDRAKRNRKYPEATAQSLRAALKLYDAELSEEEHDSLTKVKGNFEQINRSVFNKNASKFNANSLTTYKSRVLKVFADFEKYGDPAKMSNWTPKVINRVKKPLQRGSDDSSAHARTGGMDTASSPDQPYVFADQGNGWSLVIRSRQPVNSTTKTAVIAVSDKLEQDNQDSTAGESSK